MGRILERGDPFSERQEGVKGSNDYILSPRGKEGDWRAIPREGEKA